MATQPRSAVRAIVGRAGVALGALLGFGAAFVVYGNLYCLSANGAANGSCAVSGVATLSCLSIVLWCAVSAFGLAAHVAFAFGPSRRWHNACCPECGHRMPPRTLGGTCAECGAALVAPPAPRLRFDGRVRAVLVAIVIGMLASHAWLTWDAHSFEAEVALDPGRGRIRDRAFPFGHHAMGYYPGHGFYTLD